MIIICAIAFVLRDLIDYINITTEIKMNV